MDMIDKLRHGRVEVFNGDGNPQIETNTSPTDQGENDVTAAHDTFANVLAFNDGQVAGIANIPGKNSKEKTVNAALLYLLGKGNLGETKSSFREIRQVCKEHGFLDSSNFAQYLKSEKSRFIVSGSGRSQEVRLTVCSW